MRVEPSRQPEIMSHVWVLPPRMQKREALEYFERHVKPREYTFERWMYNPTTGKMVTT